MKMFCRMMSATRRGLPFCQFQSSNAMKSAEKLMLFQDLKLKVLCTVSVPRNFFCTVDSTRTTVLNAYGILSKRLFFTHGHFQQEQQEIKLDKDNQPTKKEPRKRSGFRLIIYFIWFPLCVLTVYLGRKSRDNNYQKHINKHNHVVEDQK